MYFVSGVASHPLAKGYNPRTKVWNKLKTGTPMHNMFILSLSDLEYELGFNNEYMDFNEDEWLMHNGQAHRMVNLSSAARYAKQRTVHHGGDPMLFLL